MAALDSFLFLPLLVHDFDQIRNHPYLDPALLSSCRCWRLIPLECLECLRHDTVHKLKGMHHDFRVLDRKKHDAGDLELDPMDQSMSGNSNLSLSESESAATPKSDYQSVN